ncbi:MAG: butyrate kinase [Treponema sp. RIFOXYC1_FULL_61_9]|nr:MAG: butyrate kinase [Treponema sp. GWC1_61_84]OHE69399.1 MAG: butyrate kinase [Treponema sp. RIFOXYC1_FULL_61_9]
MLRSGTWKRTPRDTFFPRPRILAINPGSTSTKLAVFEGEEQTLEIELQHSAGELSPFEGKSIAVQFAFRKKTVEDFLAASSLSMRDIDAVSARGGLLRPIAHGTYAVNEVMLDELGRGASGEHASNLGALIAAALVQGSGKPAFIVDPVVVDEMADRARVSGVKALPRRAVSHALNQIAAGHRYARERGTFRDRLNLIVCHMGGGVSIGAHRKGRVVDVNNALDGEGPFTPQRSGSLPVGDLIRLCFDGNLNREELLKLNKGRGGLIDLVGTADFRVVEKAAAEGDAQADLAFRAMGYQIAKGIASLIPAFDGEKIDRVILTGGLARSARFVALISGLLGPDLGGTTVYPGEMEMVALAQGALRVLNGNEQARSYGNGVP